MHHDPCKLDRYGGGLALTFLASSFGSMRRCVGALEHFKYRLKLNDSFMKLLPAEVLCHSVCSLQDTVIHTSYIHTYSHAQSDRVATVPHGALPWEAQHSVAVHFQFATQRTPQHGPGHKPPSTLICVSRQSTVECASASCIPHFGKATGLCVFTRTVFTLFFNS